MVNMLHAKLLEHQAILKMANKSTPNDKSESTVPTSTVSTSTEPDSTLSTSTMEAVEKVKEEPEEVKEDEEEATSTELLLVPLMATKEDHPLTSLAQLAEYVKVRMTECNEKLSYSTTSLDNENDDDSNCPVQDSQKLVLNKIDKMAQLTKLKGTLENLYTQLTLNGKQDKAY